MTLGCLWPYSGLITGNLKEVMDLIWAIIFFYSIEPKLYQSQQDGKALLHWIKDRISNHSGIPFQDFSKSFQDEMLLCAIIDSFHSLKFNEILKYKERENINRALEVAFQQWYFVQNCPANSQECTETFWCRGFVHSGTWWMLHGDLPFHVLWFLYRKLIL